MKAQSGAPTEDFLRLQRSRLPPFPSRPVHLCLMSSLRQRHTPASGKGKAAGVDPMPSTKTVTIDTTAGHLGITLSNPARGPGVLIVDAIESDLVAKAGVTSGCVIVSINKKTVGDHAAAMTVINENAGRTLSLEYWTGEDAATVARLSKSGGGAGGATSLLKWAFVVLAIGLLPVSIVFASTGTVDLAQLPKLVNKALGHKPLTSPHLKQEKVKATPTTPVHGDAPPQKAPLKKKRGRFDFDMATDPLDEIEDKLEAMSEADLIKYLKKWDKNWEPVEEERKRSDYADQLRSNILRQAEGVQAQLAEASPEAVIKKRKRRLNNMGKDELREKLLDVGVDAALSLKSKAALVRLGEQEDVLTKWDALPESLKLERSRARAEESVRLQNAKADKERAERKAKEDAKDPFEQMSEMMAPKKEWELEEWDPVTESEIMERLGRLPMWQNAAPQMMDMTLEMIRKNPKYIDVLEGEAKSQKMMQWAQEEKATIAMEDMKAMGMLMHQFDKTKKIDNLQF